MSVLPFPISTCQSRSLRGALPERKNMVGNLAWSDLRGSESEGEPIGWGLVACRALTPDQSSALTCQSKQQRVETRLRVAA